MKNVYAAVYQSKPNLKEQFLERVIHLKNRSIEILDQESNNLII